jgi:hypothetical protein
MKTDNMAALGWREWVQLPSLDVPWIKVKVDTGARTSSLHAFGLKEFERDGERWVRFVVHPWQGSREGAVTVEAPLVDNRAVKSSSGVAEPRPVIRVPLSISGETFDVDLTLTRRDEMGFRMLLGREALRGRYVVDPGRSYLAAVPPRDVRQRNREKA